MAGCNRINWPSAPEYAVAAYLHKTDYEKRMKVSKEQKEKLIVTPHSVQPKRNYTIFPEHGHLFASGEVGCQRTNEQGINLFDSKKPEVKLLLREP